MSPDAISGSVIELEIDGEKIAVDSLSYDWRPPRPEFPYAGDPTFAVHTPAELEGTFTIRGVEGFSLYDLYAGECEISFGGYPASACLTGCACESDDLPAVSFDFVALGPDAEALADQLAGQRTDDRDSVTIEYKDETVEAEPLTDDSLDAIRYALEWGGDGSPGDRHQPRERHSHETVLTSEELVYGTEPDE